MVIASHYLQDQVGRYAAAALDIHHRRDSIMYAESTHPDHNPCLPSCESAVRSYCVWWLAAHGTSAISIASRSKERVYNARVVA